MKFSPKKKTSPFPFENSIFALKIGEKHITLSTIFDQVDQVTPSFFRRRIQPRGSS